MNDKEKVVSQIHRAIEMGRRPASSKEAYFAFHQECTRKMYDISRAKNSDYTGESQNPFENFLNSVIFAGVQPEQGIMVRLGDKIARIKSLLHKGTAAVKDESLEDSILDACNYLIILAAYVKEQKSIKNNVE